MSVALSHTGTHRAITDDSGPSGEHTQQITPLAARQASCLVAHMTPQECAATLRELGNMSPSKSTLDRLPKHLSSRWEEHRAAFEEALRADTVAVPAEATALAVSLETG